jgi:type I restriction enzyme S subunit
MRTHEAASALLAGAPWPAVPFRRVAQLVRKPNADAGSVPLSVSSQGYLYERPVEGEGAQASSDETMRRNWLVEPDDIVVNPMWLVGGGIARSTLHGCVSPDYRVYRCHDLVEPRYLAYLLRTPQYIDQYALYTRGDTTFDRRVSRHDFEDLPVLLPEVEVQRRIVEHLDSETASADRLIDANDRACRLAWERFRSVRSGSVAGGVALGSAEVTAALQSRGWQVLPLWMVAKNHDSTRVPLNAEERGMRSGPYPYWGANSVQDHIDDWLFDGEFVLIAEDGGPFFNDDRDTAWVANGKFWVNNHAHILESRLVPSAWLCAALNCVDYSLYVGGSTRDKLTQADLNAIPVPIPPCEHMNHALTAMDEAAASAAATQAVADRTRRLLEERKQALITAAVTGQITV